MNQSCEIMIVHNDYLLKGCYVVVVMVNHRFIPKLNASDKLKCMLKIISKLIQKLSSVLYTSGLMLQSRSMTAALKKKKNQRCV